ncbi:MAG: aldolase catalytic domain-containing protein [Clostridia bacterium]|nr:aldolase catalytic domain-containing protein [Clostridia bacterium]
MQQKRTLLSYCPTVKVVDATIRDGGLCNDFRFSDEFIKELYQANVAAGVDYMEFGYKADRDIFDETKFGKWKFCKDDDIRAIVGDNQTELKIACMADVGRCNYKRDFIPKSESPIDLYRIATYINTIPAAIAMAEHANKLGYETTVNIMAISNAKERDISSALELLGQSCVDGIYIVDSYGSIYPEDLRRLAEKYVEVGQKYEKYIGIHAHNNQQLAFANTIESIPLGVDYLDATMSGMGRGAGNCAMELLLGFLKNPKYSIAPVLRFIEKYMDPLKQDGIKWGFSVPYALTGLLNRHPSSAIDFTKEDREDYENFYHELLEKF